MKLPMSDRPADICLILASRIGVLAKVKDLRAEILERCQQYKVIGHVSGSQPCVIDQLTCSGVYAGDVVTILKDPYTYWQ